MLKCHDLICKFLTWDVSLGDEALFWKNSWDVSLGDEVLFWENSWDGLPLIVSRTLLEELKDKLVSLWGVKVNNYKTNITSEGTDRWVWKSLAGVGEDAMDIEAFEKILSDREIKQTERKDELIWAVVNDGKYIMRNGYKALLHSQR